VRVARLSAPDRCSLVNSMLGKLSPANPFKSSQPLKVVG
jgi:hypothetical protein